MYLCVMTEPPALAGGPEMVGWPTPVPMTIFDLARGRSTQCGCSIQLVGAKRGAARSSRRAYDIIAVKPVLTRTMIAYQPIITAIPVEIFFLPATAKPTPMSTNVQIVNRST